MSRPVRLYNHALAPNPRRVRIFAAEKGFELLLEDVGILAGQSRTPEFLAKNSSGAVPVLELDDGSYLSESVAICRYLEGLHPEPNLLGRDLREQVAIERWNRRMELELFAAIGCTFRILARSFRAGSSNSRATAKRSVHWFISVSNEWIAS
jgi:glutathione S-transferase